MVKEPFVSNRAWRSVQGKHFFVNGEVIFPLDTLNAFDRSYRTTFGPFFASKASVYAETDHNVRIGLWRMLGCRIPKRNKLPRSELFRNELRLQRNQRKYVMERRPFIARLNRLYARHFDNYMDMFLEAKEHHADPHPKRLLRIEGMKNAEMCGNHLKAWSHRKVRAAFKKELVLPGKKGRMIFDFGVERSLQGFRSAKMLKEAQSEDVYHDGGIFRFMKKPVHDLMKVAFHQFIHLPGLRFLYLYFSDDAALAIRTPSGIQMFNIDISSCDRSHTPSLFNAYRDLFPPQMQLEIEALIAQNRTPVCVRSKSIKKRKCTIQPNRPFLYSGSPITTSINNLASLLLGLSYVEVDTNEDIESQIHDAADRAGYIVTVERATRMEDVQFLKCSPHFDPEREIHQVINLGVLLRASGSCKGDLPGRGPIEKRARIFQHALVHGLYPCLTNGIIRSMKLATRVTTLEAMSQSDKRFYNDRYLKLQDPRAITVSNHSLLARYRLTAPETVDLIDTLSRATLFDHITSSAVDKVLNRDYGYPL